MLSALFFSISVLAADKSKTESFKDLISKARHLTFQRDRLQATQVLIRGLQHEPKNSVAHKELLSALDELSGVFYTDKAQSLYFAAEGLELEKPKDAAEKLNEALRLEEGNLSILKSLARVHLRLGECSNANKPITAAKDINPFSSELRLLSIQLAVCEKNFDQVSSLLSQKVEDNDQVEKFTRGLRLREAQRKGDVKSAKTLLASWEAAQPDYPEVYYWKWALSGNSPTAQPIDRSAAQKYLNLCQNLSPRKKKSYNLDLELCKSVDKVEEALKSASTEGDSDEDSP